MVNDIFILSWDPTICFAKTVYLHTKNTHIFYLHTIIKKRKLTFNYQNINIEMWVVKINITNINTPQWHSLDLSKRDEKESTFYTTPNTNNSHKNIYIYSIFVCVWLCVRLYMYAYAYNYRDNKILRRFGIKFENSTLSYAEVYNILRGIQTPNHLLEGMNKFAFNHLLTF